MKRDIERTSNGNWNDVRTKFGYNLLAEIDDAEKEGGNNHGK